METIIELMDTFIELFARFFNKFGLISLVPIGMITLVGVVSQFMLYEKCKQPGVACLVPVWNVIVFLRIVGRPSHHSLLFILPPLIALVIFAMFGTVLMSLVGMGVLALIWMGFVVKVYIELSDSFGKSKLVDYCLIIILNGLYVLNLGLSLSAKYKGPVYGQKDKRKAEVKVAL